MTKLSQINGGTSTTPVLADQVVGVHSGTTDSLFSISGIAATIAAAGLSINTQTGTSYTLVLTDANGIVEMNNAAANTCTVPPNSSVAFPVGTEIDVVQIGAGATTIAAGAGVTILSGLSGGSLVVPGQYSGVTLYQRVANTWVLQG